MSPAGERMSRVDTAWLRMDNDVNLMMIVGVWMMAPALTVEAVRERVAERLLKYERFRDKAVLDAVGARWEPDPDFDIARHVVPAVLHRKRGQSEREALQALCGELSMQTLDPAHPLWQFHVIEDYEGGSALLVRIHHCIADGIALISVTMSITDGGSDPPKRRRRDGADSGDGTDWLGKAVLEPLTDITVKAIGMYGGGVAKSMEMLAHPQALLGSVEMARSGVQILQDVAALALMADDSPTALKGKPAGRKVVAWGEPLPLDAVKAVGKGLGCSVNDVLLSCVAGAIGRWLREQGDDAVDGKEIRAMVPVNLRPLDKAWQLGNRFGLAPLVLPVGIANPIERVFAVLALSGLFVKPVQDLVLGLFAKKATAVMTNVPGPAQPLKFCGSTLKQSMFWVPASGDIGVGVSVLSYGGGVQFGLITDEKLCRQPQAIIDRFEPEFEKLLLLTLMLPWTGQEGAAA